MTKSRARLKDKTLQVFLDELAGKAPTPGGGSVAAILGAQAAALISMVCNLTIGKPRYAEVEAAMQDLLQQSEALRAQLTALIQADVDVFDRLTAGYALPKTTPAEQAARSDAVQTILKQAAEVPLACAGACAEAIRLSQSAADIGNLNVVSDAGVAAMAAYAGLKSAALNVYVNVGSLKDRAVADEKLARLESILSSVDVAAEEIYRRVQARL
ncbi:MAG: methenyltetrahydrofolate cyclohydrolase [Gammaproteobacteria bacterium HGW-Gammaproteobacteria-3]|nr:MAG: methenyltetrahydrofolate cyclohydrolase [Gammaproteobacteria bacterium HGW-Gammaproteobacteria-3]